MVSLLRSFLLYFYLPALLLGLVFIFSPAAQRELLFLHNLRWPLDSYVPLQNLQYHIGAEDVVKYQARNVHVPATETAPELHGYRLSPPASSPPASSSSPAPSIIFFHGNGANRALYWRVTHIKKLADAGATVYAYDVRGSGDVLGTPTKEGVLADSIAIFESVRAEAEGDIVLYGHSLGTAVASALAGSVAADGVLLDSPFVNSTFAAMQHPSSLPLRYLFPGAASLIPGAFAENHMPSDEVLGGLDTPVLILQGDEDFEIPMHTCGGKLLQRVVLEERGRRGVGGVDMIVYPGVDHEIVHEQDRFVEDVKAFLAKIGE
ncbi:hypothetical protein TeGR_g6203 [Tetraparma gracilis]|uniref:AB hydrolase-1 domain-containing protein n=1 Tax=Tetraparma gracilis TaxID=2962635 RepID=A0ABQ6MY23_9STRA|nr:hypothetical protein TeGR_g6203 [Tetraparma gracilis]